MPIATPIPSPEAPEARERSIKLALEFFRLFLNSPEWQVFIFWLKVVAVFAIVFFVAVIVILVIKLNIIGAKFRTVRSFLRPMKQRRTAYFKREMEKIKKKLLEDREEEDRLAVIRADNLLEEALKSLGYKGETLSMILESVKPWQLKNIDEVIRAHAIRNRVVHEPTTPLTHFEAEMVLKIYEAALKELAVI